MIGAAPYQGLKLKGLTDSGCTSTILDETLWPAIPNYKDICLIEKPTYTQGAKGPIQKDTIKIAEVWITFETSDGRMISFKKVIQLHTGVNDKCYIGYDLTGGPRALLTTSHSMLLKANMATEYEILIPNADADLFEIPVYTEADRNPVGPKISTPNMPTNDYAKTYKRKANGPPPIDPFPRQNTQKEGTENGGILTIDQEITIPPIGNYITKIKADGETDFATRRYEFKHETMDGVYATSHPVGKNNRVSICIHNGLEHHITIQKGDSFIVVNEKDEHNALTVHINTIKQHNGKLENILQDQTMTQEEKALQLRKYEEKGECNVSATQYIETRPKLQILDEPNSTHNFTDDELIAGLKLDHLSQAEQTHVRNMFTERIKVLARNEFDVTPNPYVKAEIKLKGDIQAMTSKYIPIAMNMKVDGNRLIDYYLMKGVLEYCKEPTPFVSNMLFQRKKSGKINLVLG